VKRVRRVLLSISLCSCVGHGEGGVGEGGNVAEPGGLPFLDRSNPLVEHTFQIMEVRAHYSDLRERLRSYGRRVCEEGENETTWKQDCNTCRCEWGIRSCTKAGCPSPEDRAKVRAEAKRSPVPADDGDDDTFNMEWKPAVDYRELHPSISRRYCEGETSWKESCNTCWCAGGFVVCSKADCPGGR
jgi:hypothetical protein